MKRHIYDSLSPVQPRGSPAAREYKEKVRAKKKLIASYELSINDASFAIADRLYTSIFA
jgi:hypothetical protein